MATLNIIAGCASIISLIISIITVSNVITTKKKITKIEQEINAESIKDSNVQQAGGNITNHNR